MSTGDSIICRKYAVILCRKYELFCRKYATNTLLHQLEHETCVPEQLKIITCTDSLLRTHFASSLAGVNLIYLHLLSTPGYCKGEIVFNLQFTLIPVINLMKTYKCKFHLKAVSPFRTEAVLTINTVLKYNKTGFSFYVLFYGTFRSASFYVFEFLLLWRGGGSAHDGHTDFISFKHTVRARLKGARRNAGLSLPI